jgi:hypothetical protein
MKQIRTLMYVNDLFLAINAYAWWFHGDVICGWIALGNVLILVVCAFIVSGT